MILENHSYAQIIGNSEAPFINKMANSGATFVNSYAVAKPSQPNYLALYSGSTYGVTDNDAHLFSGPTLASTLAKSGKRFLGYAQRTTPRKHKPWESFVNNASYGRYFSSFPEQFSLLPHVSFVVPNNDNNMHDGSVQAGDRWLKNKLEAYWTHCKTHKCLLILTFDEPSGSLDQNIVTIVAGLQVKRGFYTQRINHYSVLRTIIDAMRVAAIGKSRFVQPAIGIWRTAVP